MQCLGSPLPVSFNSVSCEEQMHDFHAWTTRIGCLHSMGAPSPGLAHPETALWTRKADTQHPVPPKILLSDLKKLTILHHMNILCPSKITHAWY